MKERKKIDVHSHILPGIDDGARDMEESCRLLQEAVSQGITAVIATPHDYAEADPVRLRELAAEVEEEFRKRYPEFSLYLGEELFFHEETPQRLLKGEVLTMADSRFCLVEFSENVSYRSMYRGIRRLFGAGYVPVLAHMERYGCLRQKENLRDLEGSGCLFQMNYESLEGSSFRQDVRWCRRQILEGRIHFLGTDMHRTDYRPPDLHGAMEWLERHVDEELIDEMVWKNPLRMIKKEGIR